MDDLYLRLTRKQLNALDWYQFQQKLYELGYPSVWGFNDRMAEYLLSNMRRRLR